MWLEINDDVLGLAIIAPFWMLVIGAILAGFVRQWMFQRQIERSYRVRLAQWRAAVDSS